jgi:uncharacterized phage protein (TIGR02220 family)
MRNIVLPESFLQSFSERGKLYARVWGYWLSKFVDEIHDADFLEKQEQAFPNVGEIKEIYQFGIQLLLPNEEMIVAQKQEANKKVLSIAKDVIQYLNSRAESSFSIKSGGNVDLIAARLKEGYSIAEFKAVIDNKVKDWKGNDMEKYLRPVTLFAKSKFENYLNANINITVHEEDKDNRIAKLANSVAKAKQLVGLHEE